MKKDIDFVKELYKSFNEGNSINDLNLEEQTRNLCYDKYITKYENLPKEYFKNKKEGYLERGFGICPIFDRDGKLTYIGWKERDIYYRDQKDTIDCLFDYLLINKTIPTWTKVLILKSVLEIKDKETYSLVNIDKEIIKKNAKIANLMDLKTMYGDDFNTAKEIFKKLYTDDIKLKELKRKNTIDGVWVKFEASLSEYARLNKTIQGYNTGWNIEKIEPSLGVAPQNAEVYYTKDENNKYTVPRIILYVHVNGIFAEMVEGIGKNNSVEECLNDVLNQKLDTIDAGYIFKMELDNMKTLDKMYKEYKSRDLTKDELNFLYFSRVVDPRMDKIRRVRNKKEDLARVFDCDPSEIGLEKEDLYDRQLVFFDNYIIYNNMYDKMRSLGFHLPKYVRNGVILPHVKSPEGLILPEWVGGTLALPMLESLGDIKLPTRCRGINLSSIKDGEGLVLSDEVGSYYLNNLDTLVGVTLPEHRLDLVYHDCRYDLEEAKELQEEEKNTYIVKSKEKRYAYILHDWYYKRG